jgi:hypothetical protein
MVPCNIFGHNNTVVEELKWLHFDYNTDAVRNGDASTKTMSANQTAVTEMYA